MADNKTISMRTVLKNVEIPAIASEPQCWSCVGSILSPANQTSFTTGDCSLHIIQENVRNVFYLLKKKSQWSCVFMIRRITVGTSVEMSSMFVIFFILYCCRFN